MLARTLLIGLALALLTACHPHSKTDDGTDQTPQIKSRGQFILSGAVAKPGPRPLEAGETVSQALRDAVFVDSTARPMTVVLIRQGPEGKTRELINLSATGQLMETKQDYTLRDGDELMVPVPTTNP